MISPYICLNICLYIPKSNSKLFELQVERLWHGENIVYNEIWSVLTRGRKTQQISKNYFSPTTASRKLLIIQEDICLYIPKYCKTGNFGVHIILANLANLR